MLALHGWSRDHHDFDPLFSLGLPEGCTGVALDLPGFGASPPPAESWGSADYAQSISGILDEMVEHPVIVGHSFGGRVALQLAARFPTRIGGLVLTGVPLVRASAPAKSSRGYRMVRKLAKLGIIPPARLEDAKRRYGSTDYRNATGVMRDVLVGVVNERYEEPIMQIQQHVEMPWGELDAAAPLEGARRAVTMFRDANLTVVPGKGHMLPIEAPDALRDAIVRCLS